MKKLKKIMTLEITTIDSPKKVVEYLENHYDVSSAYFHFMADSMTYVFVVRLNFMSKLKYLFSNSYKSKVRATFNDSLKDIPSNFKVIQIIEL